MFFPQIIKRKKIPNALLKRILETFNTFTDIYKDY